MPRMRCEPRQAPVGLVTARKISGASRGPKRRGPREVPFGRSTPMRQTSYDAHSRPLATATTSWGARWLMYRDVTDTFECPRVC